MRKSLFGEKNFLGKTWDVQFVATDVSRKRGIYAQLKINKFTTHSTDLAMMISMPSVTHKRATLSRASQNADYGESHNSGEKKVANNWR